MCIRDSLDTQQYLPEGVKFGFSFDHFITPVGKTIDISQETETVQWFLLYAISSFAKENAKIYKTVTNEIDKGGTVRFFVRYHNNESNFILPRADGPANNKYLVWKYLTWFSNDQRKTEKYINSPQLQDYIDANIGGDSGGDSDFTQDSDPKPLPDTSDNSDDIFYD